MEHFCHRLCTDVLNPAKGDEGRVSPLHVKRSKMDGANTVTSFWRPTQAELNELLNGGCIEVTICSVTHPPLRVEIHRETVTPK
jgi:hypothetical protein